MNEQNGVRMTYGNLLTTVALAAACFWFIADVSKATDANAADLEKHVAVDEVHDQYVKDELKDIKKLLEQLAEDKE